MRANLGVILGVAACVLGFLLVLKACIAVLPYLSAKGLP